MSDRIRYQYDNLGEFARRFAEHAAAAEQTRARLTRQLAVLEDGGWLGEGAERFSAEMREQMLPALDRLAQALEAAQAGVLRMVETMQAAEQEAAGLFRSAEAAGRQGAGSAFGAANPSFTAQRTTQIAALSGLREEQGRFVQDLRRGLEGIGGQIAGVQAVYDRLFAEAGARAERMSTLIGALQGGTVS